MTILCHRCLKAVDLPTEGPFVSPTRISITDDWNYQCLDRDCRHETIRAAPNGESLSQLLKAFKVADDTEAERRYRLELRKAPFDIAEVAKLLGSKEGSIYQDKVNILYVSYKLSRNLSAEEAEAETRAQAGALAKARDQADTKAMEKALALARAEEHPASSRASHSEMDNHISQADNHPEHKNQATTPRSKRRNTRHDPCASRKHPSRPRATTSAGPRTIRSPCPVHNVIVYEDDDSEEEPNSQRVS